MAYIFIVALFSIVVFILNIKTKFIWKIQAYKNGKIFNPISDRFIQCILNTV